MEDVRETFAFQVLWRLLWVIWIPLGVFLFRQRTTWQAPFPRTGPVLLLGNHVSFWDPLWIAWPLRRGVHYMASANLFRLPGVSWFVRSLGAFPKERFVKDKDSVKRLVAHYEDGQVVARKVLHIRFSFDERVDDGLNAGKGIEALRTVLEDPYRYLGDPKADDFGSARLKWQPDDSRLVAPGAEAISPPTA